ncbi:MAG: beta-xylosidase [Candidatus Bathyarchaeia archaeon]|nr:beta-xylosidase [Candidatus Bathyarchaeota archaeon]
MLIGNVKVFVDASKKISEFNHIWRYIGYDEINYTTTPSGKMTLRRFAELSDGPYYVRFHHLLCTGNCRSIPKWGSTNVYVEDEDGNPIYNWTTIDSIFDTLLRFNCKPFVEIGFMPLHLADKRGQLSFHWWYAGWNCPPKDYEKWHNLILNLVKHCTERYGIEEVETWYWEIWNEPDLPYYWQGTFEEYCKLYDYAVAAIKKVVHKAKVGGPATTGPIPGGKSAEWLDKFLYHCVKGENFYDGCEGSPIDFVSFHAKGGGYSPVWGLPREKVKKQTPSVDKLILQVKTGLDIIEKYHELKGVECIISECDPDGWAAGGVWDNPNLEFRNTEYYPTYTATAFKKIMDLSEKYDRDIRLLTWAFVFEGERTFEGTRAFTTNGFDKPILNLFRMYSQMGNKRIFSSVKLLESTIDLNGYYIDALATISDQEKMEIMIFSHHDDWDIKGEYNVKLEIVNLPFTDEHFIVKHYRIDRDHSNAYTEWVRVGRPEYPNKLQSKTIRERQGLELYEPISKIIVKNGKIVKTFNMPVHAISLIILEPYRIS